MGVNYYDDDFSDYYYDSVGFDELEQDAYEANTISDISYSEFSKMSDKKKIDYLYSLIRCLYSSFLTVNDVQDKRR